MFRLTVLGTSSAIPIQGRMPSGQALVHNEHLLLFDCGEGTQLQLARYGLKTSRLDAIFISHLHGDHVYGLPGLLTTLSILNRTRALVLVGPAGIGAFIHGILKASHARLSYPLTIHETPLDTADLREVYRAKGLRVQTFPLDHRVPCFGFRVDELAKPRPLLPTAPALQGVPTSHYNLLKQGNAVTLEDGRVVQPEDVLGPPPPSHSFAYCSDTRYRPATAHFAAGVDLLYHEATFLSALQKRADETGHSTAHEAGLVAKEAKANRLLIGHYSARYDDLEPLRAEAAAIFPQTELAREGLTLPIPADD